MMNAKDNYDYSLLFLFFGEHRSGLQKRGLRELQAARCINLPWSFDRVCISEADIGALVIGKIKIVSP